MKYILWILTKTTLNLQPQPTRKRKRGARTSSCDSLQNGHQTTQKNLEISDNGYETKKPMAGHPEGGDPSKQG